MILSYFRDFLRRTSCPLVRLELKNNSLLYCRTACGTIWFWIEEAQATGWQRKGKPEKKTKTTKKFPSWQWGDVVEYFARQFMKYLPCFLSSCWRSSRRFWWEIWRQGVRGEKIISGVHVWASHQSSYDVVKAFEVACFSAARFSQELWTSEWSLRAA